ncbi:MAG: hypothetical protein II857_10135 [Selenomonadaceae bacterium]|nr:hypothetical protein [Selenomonadaceae bacterium]
MPVAKKLQSLRARITTPISIIGGYGADFIGGKYATINAGAGNDRIANSGFKCSINAGDGNDFVNNNGKTQATIDTGSGNDTILNGHLGATTGACDALINMGTGNDSILNYSSYLTIKTGEGSDWIKNYEATKVSIEAGDGRLRHHFSLGLGGRKKLYNSQRGQGQRLHDFLF